MIIALTGGIGAGKSSVAISLATQCKGEYLDIDAHCKWLLEKGNPGYVEFVAYWGQRFLAADGGIDRVALRQAVFSDSTLRKKLEQIIHPLARQHVLAKRLNFARRKSILIVEVPLLFEAGWIEDFDLIVAVIAKESECLKRIQLRDKVSQDQAQMIIDAQMPMEEKAKRADFVINNSGNWEDTMAQIAQLCFELIRNITPAK